MKIILVSSNTCRLELEGGKTFYLYDTTDGELDISEPLGGDRRFLDMNVTATYGKEQEILGQHRHIRLS